MIRYAAVQSDLPPLTEDEKHDAFEWLRRLAVKDGGPHEAYVAMREWSELKAALSETAPVDSSARAVAYAIRAHSDGSLFPEICPVGYTMFDHRMEAMRQHSWVVNGKAEIVPLYAAPLPDGNSRQSGGKR